MDMKKTAVIEDMDAFQAWLATMPFIIWGSNKGQGFGPLTRGASSAPPAGPDPDLLAALKSMA